MTTTILMLGAVPRDHGEVGLDHERARVEQVLNAAPQTADFRLHHVFAFRPDQLQSELSIHNPQIVHFSGHGTADGQLIVHGEGGRSRQIDPDPLARVLVGACDTVRCVFLNACFGAEQAASIAETIHVVIGPERELPTRAAAEAAAAFYQALCCGRSITNAVELANGAPELCGHGDLRIRLFSRPGVDPSTMVFANPRPSTPTEEDLKLALVELFSRRFTQDEFPVVLRNLGIGQIIRYNTTFSELTRAAAEAFVANEVIDSRWFDKQIADYPRAKARGRAFAQVKELWVRVMGND